MARLEWRVPAPFPGFTLGRFGHVPNRGKVGLYGGSALALAPSCALSAIESTIPCGVRTTHPFIGAALITPFDLIRIDIAHGLNPRHLDGGVSRVKPFARWTFSVDVNREFWSIL